MILKAILLHCVIDMGTGARETHDVFKVTGYWREEGREDSLVVLSYQQLPPPFPGWALP